MLKNENIKIFFKKPNKNLIKKTKNNSFKKKVNISFENDTIYFIQKYNFNFKYKKFYDFKEIIVNINSKILALSILLGTNGSFVKDITTSDIKSFTFSPIKKEIIASAWALDEHKDFTKKGLKSLSKIYKISDNNVNKKVIKRSIEYGGAFNDVGARNTNLNSGLISFGANYILGSDEFINQSHYGKMQYLHSMKYKHENPIETQKKIKIYFEFVLKMISNIDNNQSKTLKNIIKNNENFKEIFPKKLINENKRKTLKDFYIGGNRGLNLKYVMFGSLCHIIEDSFAKSHAQRLCSKESQQIFIDNFEEIDNMNLEEKEALLDELTPITIFANYKKQSGNFHKKADFAVGTQQKNIRRDYQNNKMNTLKTNSAPASLFTVNTFLHKVLTTSNIKEIMNLVDKIFKIDRNVLEINRDNKIFEDINWDFLNNENKNFLEVTQTGRQYEKLNWQGNFIIKKNNPFFNYNKLLDEERGTDLYSNTEILNRYWQQIQAIEKALEIKINPTIAKNVSNHATEMLLMLDKVNLERSIKNSDCEEDNRNSQNIVAKEICIKRLSNIINKCLKLQLF